LKAIILAAGEGNRLRPLTNEKPKCLVNLFGKTLLEWQINVLNKCGIHEIVIVTGYKSEKLQNFSTKIYHNQKYDTTNMVESLFLASKEFESPLIVSYGDIIYEKKVLESLINSPFDISLVIDSKWKKYWEKRFDDPLSDAESLVLNNNRVMEVGKQVNSYDKICGQYVGLMKFQGPAIEIIKNHYLQKKSEAKNGKNPMNDSLPFEKSYLTDFLNSMINENIEINAVSIDNGWLELDTISDYKLYNELYEKDKLSTLIELDDCK
jgi:choline kinase